jgi:hypothetical protein
MGWRDGVMAMLDAMLDVGRVTASSVGSAAKSVLVTIEGAGTGEQREQREGQALWGHAAILARPKPPTSSPSGHVEALFLRRGEELIPIATRDLRWQIDLEEGDVVIRNLDGTKPTRLHLLASGVAVLEADEVRIGDSGATNTIGLGDVIKNYLTTLRSELETLRAAHNTHNHPTAPVGVVSPPSVLMPVSFSSVPDIESRHKVEN